MSDTPHLALPLLAAAQAQKHVTHNEALALVDALVHLSVKERDRIAPPSDPAEGDRYLVGTGAGGAFAGHEGEIAFFDLGHWRFLSPRAGWRAHIEAEERMLVHDGAAWRDLGLLVRQLANLEAFGLGTAPDAQNPFAAKLNKVLWTARTVGEGGDGDLRYTLNKESTGDVLSLLFQSAYAACAELGLIGNDDLTLRTSADGSAFVTAARLRRADGRVSFPQGIVHEATGQTMSGLIFTPGGDGQVSFYRNDTARSPNPRSASIGSISGDIVTLATASADLFFHPYMQGVSYARIWNVSKSPAQPAWVQARPSTSTLQVLDAGALAGWLPGETIQIGDPTDITPGRVIALDISPMLQTVLGAVFRQTGMLCKGTVNGVGGSLALTPSGVAGSFVACAQATDAGVSIGSVAAAPCTIASPISNSNLVFVRETVGASNQLGVTLASTISVTA